MVSQGSELAGEGTLCHNRYVGSNVVSMKLLDNVEPQAGE
ncbi:MAG: hypothetical protein JWP26_3112 [Devosia sp.]|nr:hypothetical protein [Devosia sp.]MDB5588142.1 hypothetical protein [Devosia sp.]